MCDKDSIEDMLISLKGDVLNRRRFGALSLGAGLVAALPRAADAADVVETDVEIKTPDGTADAYFAHPVKGKTAGVLAVGKATG
jgi:carboxymethylenebutenolidase